MTTIPLNIVWFRRDLRLADNPALTHAHARGAILPIYILDDHASIGSASKWWLHQSLIALNQSLSHHLNFYRGNTVAVLAQLLDAYAVTGVFFNACFEPWYEKLDDQVKSLLAKRRIDVGISNASLLYEPQEIMKADGTAYKIFTAYYHRAIENAPAREPLPKPQGLHLVKDNRLSVVQDELKLMPTLPWYRTMETIWNAGEESAQNALNNFLHSHLKPYKEKRDFPAAESVSRLSPHLHFGEISPQQIFHAVDDTNHAFIRELIWRDFGYYLLHHFPQIATQNLVKKFDRYPWRANKKVFRAWCRGQTGYPLIDAGMRELWQTGYMHNRVRMAVASFLVKNCAIHWQEGARWFLDCLLDADLANNSMNWQWVAGTGVDASPFFRIFNPITQGEKFDPSGDYTRHYVPELAKMPTKYLFKPWAAPDAVLKAAGVSLGTTYPYPVVDYAISREYALEAFKAL